VRKPEQNGTATKLCEDTSQVERMFTSVTDLPLGKGCILNGFAAFFSLVGCAILAFASLFRIAPLVVLGGGQYLSVFKVEQLRALASLFLELYSQGVNICFVFFGVYCLLIGYLIFRSAFLPRILSVPMAFAGLGWLTFLSPPLANYLFPYILVLGFLAELTLMLWLLVMGVNVQRWKEQASAA
jgi:Domain of unknown function (DUF4386)